MRIYTAGYSQSKALPTQRAINIACRPSALWRKSGSGVSIGILFPGREVWAAGKSGGDWKAAYMQQLARHAQTGKLSAACSIVQDGDVLMCWEVDAKDCHRLIAAEFLAANIPGIEYAGEFWEQQALQPPGASSRQRLLFT